MGNVKESVRALDHDPRDIMVWLMEVGRLWDEFGPGLGMPPLMAEDHLRLQGTVIGTSLRI